MYRVSRVSSLFTGIKPKQTRGFFIIVSQNEFAYREFLGTNRILLKPGIHLHIPFLHRIMKIDTRERCLEMNDLEAHTEENIPVLISGTLFFKVNDAEKACYKVDNYVKAIELIGQSALRATIGQQKFDEITSDRTNMNKDLKNNIGSRTKEWDVECISCEIQKFTAKNENMVRQLERQAEAERRRRENELDTQAAIRTAEGEKQKMILHSQGELEAAKNRTEAEKYALEQQAEAISRQIDKIAEKTGSAETAVKLLLESKRLDHLAEMAKHNNRVYFMDSTGAFPTNMNAAVVDTLFLRDAGDKVKC